MQGKVQEDCYMPVRPDPVAKLNTPRSHTASVALGTKIWVTGGQNENREAVKSTEIIDVLNSPATVVAGPELPTVMWGHCIVKVNSTTDFFIYREKTYFFNHPSQSWTRGPDLNMDKKDGGCGIMKLANGSDVVVAAGGSMQRERALSTEFLVLDGSMKWVAGKKACFHEGTFFQEIFVLGPNLPDPLEKLSMVEFEETVVVIGGYCNMGCGWSNSQSLLQLACFGGQLDMCEWKAMSQKLKVGRYGFVAMTLQDEMAQCQ